MSKIVHRTRDALKHVTKNSRITVRYDSKRSDDILQREAKVGDAWFYRGDEPRIHVSRDDGKNMYLVGNELHSDAVKHSGMGEIIEIEIHDPVESPLPEQAPKEVMLAVAHFENQVEEGVDEFEAIESARELLDQVSWWNGATEEQVEKFSERALG